jgi:hypothetical protein
VSCICSLISLFVDTVYGAVFASWFLGESLGGPVAYAGAGIITLAAATNAVLDFSASSDATTNDFPDVRGIEFNTGDSTVSAKSSKGE